MTGGPPTTGAPAAVVVADAGAADAARAAALEIARLGLRTSLVLPAAAARRSEADLGPVHVVRVPVGTALCDAAAARERRRSAAPRVLGYADAADERAARLRAQLAAADAAARGGAAAAVASAYWRGRGELVRVRSAAQRRVVARAWSAGRRALASAGSRLPRAGWRGDPRVGDLELALGPVLDALKPTVVLGVGPAGQGLATRAAERAAAAGRPLLVARPGDGVPQQVRDLAAGLAPVAVPANVTEVARAKRRERPYLLIGPANMAGQGWEWARAAERGLGVDAEVLTVTRGNLAFVSDTRVSAQDFARNPAWQRGWTAHVLDTATHTLLEAGRPLLGTLHGRDFAADVDVLRSAGIAVGLVFHGSEIRDPRRHAELYAESPFRDPHAELTARLQRQVDELAPKVAAFDGPRFFSTPDLLDDVPGGLWLPVVIDTSVWAPQAEPLQRARPVVVHAPSNKALKGTARIEPVLAELEAEGLIEYRRLEGIPPEQMPAALADADVVLDHFVIGNYGVLTCQAMATGRVSVSHISDRVRSRVPSPIPTIEATAGTLADVLRGICADRDAARATAAQGPAFVTEFHDGRYSAAVLAPFLGAAPPPHG
ncbi:hypothetical protein [Motilibacter aurantiacus]|uniref:hypothetical protein n=1 Tax=Motilibacter aurantiacus TaxID=2714955 RepID=UPI001408E81F|nr:hypothetical protein [Motilibacter aurantiacus]NHC43836.1 hypothetical protein [Motilibacter aurantiacus]